MGRSRRATALSVIGLAVLGLAIVAVGPLAAAGAIVGLGLLALVLRPAWALSFAILVPLAIEPDWPSMSSLQRVYSLVPGTKVSPIDILVLAALAAGLLDFADVREAVRRVGMMRLGLALLALGLIVGALTGKAAGVGTFEVINDGRYTIPIFLMPVVVVSIVGRRTSLERVLGIGFAATVVKATAGLLAYAAHQSSPTGLGFVTYINAPANIVTMFALLFLLAARMRRVTLPAWMWWSTPLLLGSLLLSYRRSFWIGTLLGAVILIAVLLGPRARRFVFPAAAIVVLVFALALSGTAGAGLLGDVSSDTGNTSSLSGRLLSLNPSTLSSNASDRYRTEERRNVLADLARSPITGLGLGVAYPQRYPESFETITHLYVHFAALWWWMKGGIVALAGYIVFLASMILAGVRIYRRHPEPLVAAAGAAAAAGVLGFAFAEVTATFMGPDIRTSVLMGSIAGLLAVGVRQTRSVPAAAGR